MTFFLVPVVGLEPTRYRYQRILSPPRLPIPTHRRLKCYTILADNFQKGKCFFGTFIKKYKLCLAKAKNAWYTSKVNAMTNLKVFERAAREFASRAESANQENVKHHIPFRAVLLKAE